MFVIAGKADRVYACRIALLCFNAECVLQKKIEIPANEYEFEGMQNEAQTYPKSTQNGARTALGRLGVMPEASGSLSGRSGDALGTLWDAPGTPRGLSWDVSGRPGRLPRAPRDASGQAGTLPKRLRKHFFANPKRRTL